MPLCKSYCYKGLVKTCVFFKELHSAVKKSKFSSPSYRTSINTSIESGNEEGRGHSFMTFLKSGSLCEGGSYFSDSDNIGMYKKCIFFSICKVFYNFLASNYFTAFTGTSFVVSSLMRTLNGGTITFHETLLG